jgi:phage baseplate assembly protein W
MSGIDSENANLIDEMTHIRQSIQDILLTMPGERVMRRDYGSWLRALVDAPLDPITIMDIRAASIGAISRWEPRIFVEQVEPVTIDASGQITFTIAARHRRTGRAISFADLRFQR